MKPTRDILRAIRRAHREGRILADSGVTAPDATCSEKEFMARVLELAWEHGWRVAHFRRARTKDGWTTPVAADGKGFPDLCLVRGNVILFCELKVGNNQPTQEQRDWLTALDQTLALVFVWRPEMWDEIVETLK